MNNIRNLQPLVVLAFLQGILCLYQREIGLDQCFKYCMAEKYQKGEDIVTCVGRTLMQDCWTRCEWRKGIKQNTNKRKLDENPPAKAYIESLRLEVEDKHHPHRLKRQLPEEIFERPEYRMMSDEKRSMFHSAIWKLRHTLVGNISEYDALAAFHSGDTQFTAHGGCAFPGWHRIYLLMYEEALNREEPGLGGIPYWDSTLDYYLGENAHNSIMWSDEFAGNGEGTVVSGPFVPHPSADDLVRNVGMSGQPYSETAITNVTSRTRMHEICGSNSSAYYDIEYLHGPVHIFVDGNMGVINTAAQDPVFFLHHAFVDCVWEMFRENSERHGVDIENDYPETFGDFFHAPNMRVTLETRNNLTNFDVLEKTYSSWYRCAPRPTCDVTTWSCGSKYLRCAYIEGNARCVSLEIGDVPVTTTTSTTTSTTTTTPSTTTTTTTTTTTPLPTTTKPATTPKPDCPTLPPYPTHPPPKPYPGHRYGERSNIRPVQNTFCMNGDLDIDHWMYIPIRVTLRRPYDYKAYKSYPIRNGKTQRNEDIYSPPSARRKVYRYVQPGRPKGYDNCKTSATGAGLIYIQTDGMNYQGSYTEYAIVDNRLAMSVAVAYVAIKAPTSPYGSEVMFSAFDHCGRMCHPSCLNTTSGIYQPCTGALRFTDPNMPRYRDSSYGYSVDKVWDFNTTSDCPQFKTDSIHVSFFCDYSDRWPWPSAKIPVDYPRLRVPSLLIKKTEGPKRQRKPRKLQTCRARRNSFWASCPIRRLRCTDPCTHGELFECTDRCNMYGQCLHNTIKFRHCPRGTSFNPRSKYCDDRYRCQIGRGRNRNRNRNRFLGRGRSRNVLSRNGRGGFNQGNSAHTNSHSDVILTHSHGHGPHAHVVTHESVTGRSPRVNTFHDTTDVVARTDRAHMHSDGTIHFNERQFNRRRWFQG